MQERADKAGNYHGAKPKRALDSLARPIAALIRLVNQHVALFSPVHTKEGRRRRSKKNDDVSSNPVMCKQTRNDFNNKHNYDIFTIDLQNT